MALNQIGKVLAEMHNHKRVMWGPLFETPIRNLMRNRKSFLAKRFELAIDRIRELERAGELSRGQAKDLTLSLTTEKSGIPPRSGYELMHDDLNSSNIILREDKPVLIDIDDVRFGDFSYDLFRAERRLCTDDRERHLLRDAYFAAAGRTSLEIYNDSKHFFEMDYHLRCASHCLRRSGGKEREERGSGFHERYRSHREQLMAFIS